ncbi:hypothetical protein CHLRE_01g008550v5 [Chlamydomonas reinhardtii]|uniref:Protein kinase domain-containing protein n=1 Tax=Chlamydomonas reinhardtii TaxID=3055 RepID=A0A2K3E5D4_CHLRE|nr:uncharacterized protein CHLRE_01g008550v5 [Chlamydomonas reinhardtii]PNW87957.1 hypothetical protein CHLRE_01g008550v5 [Chlamydomonas reinhardtii]
MRQATLEEEEAAAAWGRETQLVEASAPHADEYESPNDLGFWRVDIEDQAAFICNELDLSDEQALYLLNALGLLPEGAALPDFRGQPEGQQQYEQELEQQQEQDASQRPSGSMDEVEEPVLRDALESWQDMSDEDEDHRPSTSQQQMRQIMNNPEFGYQPGDNGGQGEEYDYYDESNGNGRQDYSASSSQSAMVLASAGGSFQVSIKPNISEAKPSGHKVAPGVPALKYDQSSFDREYEVIHLRVVGRRASTAAAMGEEIELVPGKLIAGRYQVLEQVGAAAFSRAVQAYDTLERRLVCLKVVKNDKECMDACLEEVRLLQLINSRDPRDENHVARLYDYFYHLGHLFLVVELLGGNLFDTQCYDPSYFTPGRMQSIARQVLQALAFLHANQVIHADIKPENILVKNYTKCSVKVIDLGCSIYNSEAHLSHYVQSRSYRAPEVMLGLPYDGRIDIWSLGCVMAELATGQVLFPNVSEAAMMARLVGMLGELPPYMLQEGQYAGAFFTKSGRVYERDAESGLFQLLAPKRTTLQARLASPDRGMLHFIRHLLVADPSKRPTAEQALRHPWLQYRYRSPK